MISDEKEFSQLLKTDGFVLVGFTSKHCAPCKRIAPEFQKLSLKFLKIKFASVNTDNLKELSDAYPETESIPCFIMFQSGKKIDTINTSREKKLRDWCSLQR